MAFRERKRIPVTSIEYTNRVPGTTIKHWHVLFFYSTLCINIIVPTLWMRKLRLKYTEVTCSR